MPEGDIVWWTCRRLDELRVLLRTARGAALGYRLPVVELVPTAREGEVVGHLGPDLLGADWDVDEAVRRLAAVPDRTIGVVDA